MKVSKNKVICICILYIKEICYAFVLKYIDLKKIDFSFFKNKLLNISTNNDRSTKVLKITAKEKKDLFEKMCLVYVVKNMFLTYDFNFYSRIYNYNYFIFKSKNV